MKNIVITGSTRGIGLAMAREFLRYGCNVTISGRNEAVFELLKDELKSFSEKTIFIRCDVTKADDIEKLWSASVEKWGKIDIWINNAGRNCPYEYIYDTKSTYVDDVINTNIIGMIYGSQTAAKHMLIRGSGQIWNMEGLGSNDMIQPKTILYGTSKRALTYFTKGLAKELSKTNVTAGRLSPGMMLTEFITKTCEGEESPVLKQESFRKIFNILADKPETVAKFFIPRMLKNTKNNAHIVFLTNAKAMQRFICSPIVKKRLI